MIFKIVSSLLSKFSSSNLTFFRSYVYSPKRDKLCARRKGCANDPPKNQTIFGKLFKNEILKHYWYVTLPIHMANSTIWFGGCYLLTEEGFNILKVLEDLDVHSVLIDYLTDSVMGKFTVSYALYKFISPIRYGTTVYATSVLVRHLTKIGILKVVKKKEKKKFF